jgi:hypothetical protein
MGANVIVLALVLAVLGLVVWLVSRTYLRLRGKRLITCPETKEPAAVELDLKYATVTSAVGKPHFRLKDCSRWPEREHCGQMCLTQLEGAPEDCLVRVIVARWYEGKKCAYCRKEFGEILWHDHKPALMSPDGVTLQWNEIPPEQLPHVFLNHRPVCWNCHVAELFRRDHPDLVVDRPPRPASQGESAHNKPAA